MTVQLICPGCCPSITSADVRVLVAAGDLLVCDCGRRYPVLDGIPVVVRDLPLRMHDVIPTLERGDPVAIAELVAASDVDSHKPQFAEDLSTYLDGHWGDHADPPPEHAGFGLRELAARIAARREAPVRHACELGCSAGRITAELAAGADHVVAIEAQQIMLRRARRILAGERVPFRRRVIGPYYADASITAVRAPLERITLVCGDALAPPLQPAMFDRVVALNVLDNIRDPAQLLTVMDSLCAVGGELIISCSYHWHRNVTPKLGPLASADPAGALIGWLGPRYRIEDEAEVPWLLRRDARCFTTYVTHYVRARKL
jgi:SAM-dependent methyltransferase